MMPKRENENWILALTVGAYSLANIIYYLLCFWVGKNASNPFFIRLDNWQISVIYAPILIVVILISFKIIFFSGIRMLNLFFAILFTLLIAVVNLGIIIFFGGMYA